MNKSLEIKLEKIKKLNYKPKNFIIADAKDADMAMGIIHQVLKEMKKAKS